MRCLVTGATGFIGSTLLPLLLAEADEVRVVVRPRAGRVDSEMDTLLRDPRVEVLEGDLVDVGVVARATDGMDVVCHLAWHSRRRANGDGQDTDPAAVNLAAVRNLIEACRKSSVTRLVLASTLAVYADQSEPASWPIGETAPLREAAPDSAYTRDYVMPKVEAENLVREAARDGGPECVILRPSIVYGPGWHGADQLVERALRGEPGRSDNVLQMVHVRDAARAFLLAMTVPAAPGRQFNVAGDDPRTTRELLQMVRQLQRRRTPLEPSTGKTLERYDTTKAELVLDFAPSVPLREGMADMIQESIVRTRRSGAAPRIAAQEPLASHAGEVGAFYDERIKSKLIDEYYGYSDYWNWGLWDRSTRTQRQASENLVQHLLDRIPVKTGRILDVACGKGASTRQILRHCAPDGVVGINITDSQLERCRRNAPGCEFLLMDATDLEFPDRSFDNVICVEAAGHFDTRDDFLREAHRVLRPGGRLVMSDAIFAPPPWLRGDERRVANQNYVHDADEYGDRLRGAGFADVQSDDVSGSTWFPFARSFSTFLRRKVWTGEMDADEYRTFMGWLHSRWSSFDFYVIASGTRP
jgi:MPBQ/MSBQ methyltransferase